MAIIQPYDSFYKDFLRGDFAREGAFYLKAIGLGTTPSAQDTSSRHYREVPKSTPRTQLLGGHFERSGNIVTLKAGRIYWPQGYEQVPYLAIVWYAGGTGYTLVAYINVGWDLNTGSKYVDFSANGVFQCELVKP